PFVILVAAAQRTTLLRFFCLMLRLPPPSTLFPYTTLFRSTVFGATRGNGLLKHGQIATCPEVVLKAAGLFQRAFKCSPFTEDIGPRENRDSQQDQHDKLNGNTGIEK